MSVNIWEFCFFFKISPCDFSTEHSHILQTHKNSKHRTSIMRQVWKKQKSRSFKCSTRYATICETVCETRAQIKKHYRMIHEGYKTINKGSAYMCLKCDYKTKEKKWYYRHKLKKHTQGAQSNPTKSIIQDEDLEQVSNNKENFINIEDGKLGSEETNEHETNSAVNAICEQIKCADCGNSFTESPGLVEHFTRNCGCLMITQ